MFNMGKPETLVLLLYMNYPLLCSTCTFCNDNSTNNEVKKQPMDISALLQSFQVNDEK